MPRCETCECEEIPWEPYVTVADGKEYYFCSHACQRYYELHVLKVSKERYEPVDEKECERRRKIVEAGKGSSYGSWDVTTPE
ncbi:MAG: hypothetical protein ACXQS7_02140 [Candidatus Syntropharchaeia archaeon]